MVSNIDNSFVIDQIKTITNAEPQLEEDYSLLGIEPTERLQVRIDKNNAPKEMVDRFRFQMSESKFPPIVVTKDGKIIDGNTRYQARLAREETRSPVLVVPISWDDADPETQERLLLLGLALNNVNGKPLDQEERGEMVKHAINVGLSNAQIMYRIGVGEKVIRSLRSEMEARRRLSDVGVEPDKIAPAILRSLGTNGAISLDDESYRDLASLAVDASLKSNEVKGLATTLRDTSSTELRQERLTREREAQAQRIAEVKRGGEGQPPRARQLRTALALLTESDHPADVFVERNAEHMADHVRVLQIAVAVLNRVLELQAQVMPTAGAAE